MISISSILISLWCLSDILRMQQAERSYMEKIFSEHESDILQLCAQEKELKEREQRLQHKEAQNQMEKTLLHRDLKNVK